MAKYTIDHLVRILDKSRGILESYPGYIIKDLLAMAEEFYTCDPEQVGEVREKMQRIAEAGTSYLEMHEIAEYMEIPEHFLTQLDRCCQKRLSMDFLMLEGKENFRENMAEKIAIFQKYKTMEPIAFLLGRDITTVFDDVDNCEMEALLELYSRFKNYDEATLIKQLSRMCRPKKSKCRDKYAKDRRLS